MYNSGVINFKIYLFIYKLTYIKRLSVLNACMYVCMLAYSILTVVIRYFYLNEKTSNHLRYNKKIKKKVRKK